MFEIADAIKSGDVKQIIAQSLGIIAFIIATLSFQRKTQRGIMVMQVCSCFCFTVHFLILGVMGGFILNFIAFFRSIVYSFRKTHKFAASVVWVYVFMALVIAAGIYSYIDGDGLAVILPSVGMFVTTLAGRMEHAKTVRSLTLLNSPLWLAYNIIKGSVGGMLTEIVSFCSIIIGILRLDIKKKSKEIPFSSEENAENV